MENNTLEGVVEQGEEMVETETETEGEDEEGDGEYTEEDDTLGNDHKKLSGSGEGTNHQGARSPEAPNMDSSGLIEEMAKLLKSESMQMDNDIAGEVRSRMHSAKSQQTGSERPKARIFATIRAHSAGSNQTRSKSVVDSKASLNGDLEDTERRIGEYRVLEWIGKGSEGTVYKCEHLDSGQIVAIKTVVHKRLPKWQRRKPRANLREVALLKNVKHPNLVQLLGVIEDDAMNCTHLVLEYVDGGPLKELSDKNLLRGKGIPLPEETARSYFRQLISALHYLHYHHILHRDIKPSNLLVDSKSGLLKLTDFGIATESKSEKSARVLGNDDDLLVYANVSGTPAFLPPEYYKSLQEEQKMYHESLQEGDAASDEGNESTEVVNVPEDSKVARVLGIASPRVDDKDQKAARLLGVGEYYKAYDDPEQIASNWLNARERRKRLSSTFGSGSRDGSGRDNIPAESLSVPTNPSGLIASTTSPRSGRFPKSHTSGLFKSKSQDNNGFSSSTVSDSAALNNSNTPYNDLNFNAKIDPTQKTPLLKYFRGRPADIWAAGVTLYTFTYGQLPFLSTSTSTSTNSKWVSSKLSSRRSSMQNATQQQELDGMSVSSLQEQIIYAPLRPPGSGIGVSPKLKDLISRMLEKDPEKRIKMHDILTHPWLCAYEPMPPLSGEQKGSIEPSAEEKEKAILDISTVVKSIARAARSARSKAHILRSKAAKTMMSRSQELDLGASDTDEEVTPTQ